VKVERPKPADLSVVFKREEKVEKRRTLNISLLATATGSVNMALVNVDGAVKLVRIGTQIDGYRVAQIERNYIILSEGKEKRAVGFSLLSASKTTEGSFSAQTLQAIIQKREVEAVTSDPGIMFRQIRLVPYVQEGRTTGFLFEWVDPQSMFSKVGIMPGDVLISINNQPIRSGEDAFRILQVLRNESSFRISLLREGKPVDLLIRVE